ncbi:MAG: hypothetical protein A2381_11530 [Bdellovibrionales bacterium RIFOXYB1_FULL_37_110]|nr:MAG: hypothetical protein A2417_11835 [Bdellovibrionales bacterium RIFOXYC1_FULL_37_79]OFZ57321.1 MAG: hypothetical protein A2381_11530 [Bdellovibrionales bacterium RIFOXYB1_FULL_37_110]OFZ62217.1 MAG: hypothetical protein A2577_14080 [Bdellovibrionales bacterium RIFOXYD1_FULL_36_51]
MNNKIKSFDVARGFALFLMVHIHIMEECALPDFTESFYAFIIHLLSSPLTASLFVFIMGVFFQISDKPTLKSSIIRGVKLIALGYFLNFIRFTLPVYIALNLDLFTLEDIAPKTPLSYMRINDILQFAGLALIFMAFAKRYFKNPLTNLFLSLIFIAGSPFLWDFTTSNIYLDLVLENFWGDSVYMNFPFFPWIVFPLLGMTYGAILKKVKDTSRFFLYSFILGVIMVPLGLYLFSLNPEYISLQAIHDFSVGCTDYDVMIYMIGTILLFIPFCHGLTKYLPSNFIFDRLCYWSKNVTSFYIIHWILVGWLAMDISDPSSFGSIVLIILILIATDRLVMSWNGFKQTYKINNLI